MALLVLILPLGEIQIPLKGNLHITEGGCRNPSGGNSEFTEGGCKISMRGNLESTEGISRIQDLVSGISSWFATNGTR